MPDMDFEDICVYVGEIGTNVSLDVDAESFAYSCSSYEAVDCLRVWRQEEDIDFEEVLKIWLLDNGQVIEPAVTELFDFIQNNLNRDPPVPAPTPVPTEPQRINNTALINALFTASDLSNDDYNALPPAAREKLHALVCKNDQAYNSMDELRLIVQNLNAGDINESLVNEMKLLATN